MDHETHTLKGPSSSRDLFMVLFEGFSMYPFIRPGDRLVVNRHLSRAVRVGDVILFRGSGESLPFRLIAHRVIEMKREGELLTKGDNLPLPDVTLEGGGRVVGLVVFVVRKGRMISMAGGGYGHAAKWIAFLSRKNLTPGILMAKARDLMGISR